MSTKRMRKRTTFDPLSKSRRVFQKNLLLKLNREMEFTAFRFDTNPTKFAIDHKNRTLTASYADGTYVVFRALRFRQMSAVVATLETASSLEPNQIFTVGKYSFRNGPADLKTAPSRRFSMVALRPWLKNDRCIRGRRQGTFGHYFLQSDLRAPPLT